MSTERNRGTRASANLFGYFGHSGEAVAAAFDSARRELLLDPLQEAPATTDSGKALFLLSKSDSRAVSQVVAPDGSFLAMIGEVYEAGGIDGLFEQWMASGVDSFQAPNFEGFVVAWNAAKSELRLIRDRFGMEVGYYAKTPDGVVFSDDQMTLVRMGVDRTINAAAIDTMLTVDYFPAPLTPYKAIKKIAPGASVDLTTDDLRQSTWARYLPVEPIPYEDAVGQIGPVVEASLRRMWPADGDVGLLLSGGIDSAMVAVGIKKMLGQPVRAFTFQYEEYHGRLNESGKARVVAEHLGIPHEEIPIRPHEMLDDLDDLVAMYGEPFNWGLHSYKMGPIADHGIRTVFSGAGADGTGIAKRLVAARRFNGVPGAVRNVARLGVRGLRPLGLGIQHKAEWVTRRVDGIGDLYSKDSEFGRLRRAEFYRDPTLADTGGRLLRSIFESAVAEMPAENEHDALAVMDKRFTAAEAGSTWNRTFTRGNGLQGRFPFVDHAYSNLGLGTIGADGKELVRRLASQHLPDAVVNAPKQPQEMPVGDWIRGPLADSVRNRLYDLPTAMEQVFDPAGIRNVVDRHIAGSDERDWEIISLLTLESWFRQVSG